MQERNTVRPDKAAAQARAAERRKKSRDRGLIIILIVIAICSFFLYKVLIEPVVEKTKYDYFINEFTDAINDSKLNGGIQVDFEDGTFTMDEYSTSYIYENVISFGLGVPWEKGLEGEVVTLTFPNGAKLKYAEGDIEQGVRKGRKGLVMYFKDTKGKEYCYIYDMGKFASTKRYFQDVKKRLEG